MPLLDNSQTAHALRDIASAITAVELALDNLWLALPLEAEKRLTGTVPELHHINATLALRVRNVADDLDAKGDAGVAFD